MQYTATGYANIFDGSIRSFKDFTMNFTVGPKFSQIFLNDTIPVQEGWTTSYAIESFTMSIVGGPTLTSVTPGIVRINNITQAEAGSQFPLGMSMQIIAQAGSNSIHASLYGADSVEGTGETLPQEPYGIFTKSILSVNGTPGSLNTISAVPEPFTALMMAFGILAIGIKQKFFGK